MIDASHTRSDAGTETRNRGIAAVEEPSTKRSLVVMSLFLLALAGTWALTYFLLMGA
ncbi:MAG TPA: hypothetical protein VGA70_05060 [Longimicrobiales bacterium]|jgi:hypothetical protein